MDCQIVFQKVSSIYTSSNRIWVWLLFAALPQLVMARAHIDQGTLDSEKVQCESWILMLLFDIDVFIKYPKIEQETNMHWPFRVRVTHWVLKQLDVHQGLFTWCLWTLPQTPIPLNRSACPNLNKSVQTRGHGCHEETWE